MADANSIEALIYRYAAGYDNADVEAIAACYTEDAVFSWAITDGPTGGPYIGRAAAVASHAESLAGQSDIRRHIMSNIIVTESGDRATATSYLLLGAIAQGTLRILATGRYSDEIVRTEQGWRFSSRSLQMDCSF